MAFEVMGFRLEKKVQIRSHSTTTWTEFLPFLRGQNHTFSDPTPSSFHVVIEWPLSMMFFKCNLGYKLKETYGAALNVGLGGSAGVSTETPV